MMLKELLPSLGVYRLYGSDQVEIHRLTADSREVSAGSLFVALPGSKVDGHSFLPEAVAKGAVAAVVERGREVCLPEGISRVEVGDTRRALAILADQFYGHPAQKLSIIGVTGTNGKTTTTTLIRRILQYAGIPTGLIGTIETVIGDERLPAKNTTPESIELQRMFKKMVDKGLTHCVMEVSSHALSMGRVRGIPFSQAIFTNLTQDHLDYHGTLEAYAQAKGLLFAQMGNAYEPRVRPVILNADDDRSLYYAFMTAQPVVTYGIEKEADVRAVDVKLDEEGTSFRLLLWDGRQIPARLFLMGRFNLYNALAALTSALLQGIPVETGLEAIREVHGINGRFERVCAGQDFTVIVDYAHTPDGLENALSTIRQFAGGRVLCVVGAGGERDRSKRPKMARVAQTYADILLLTSDNPRREDPLVILKEMEAGLTPGEKHVEVIPDRREAIARAVELARPGDVLLIAGKGHETYQILGTQVIHFDDREVVREAIRRHYRA